MTPEEWKRVKSALGDALDLDAPQRGVFVESLRRSEPQIAGEVDRLLAQHHAAGGFMETPAAVLEPMATVSDSDGAAPTEPDAQIGPFRIVGVLGEGGMGIVYRAEQESPRRTVALKVIRPGLAAESTLRRFEHETEALGRLQHPGIAQVYQAGTAGAGRSRRPYFAMELVQGATLTEYANQQNLGTRQRLELFIAVCDAVQHAHMKGVIHRDLKPANIIVDEHGRPKVLDFGIARVTDSDVRTATIQTSVGQIVGTVPYMSPEQIAGDPADLDTRSDVYALGVVLYELLAGRLPYDLSEKSIIEAARVIRESAPSRLGHASRTLKGGRGELETIVGKALEKDKRRRYQSAAELAADLQRYLRQEPIAARPPSAIYHLRKFAARNRILVGAAGAIFLVLVGALVALTIERSKTTTALAAVTIERNRTSDALAEATDARNKTAQALAAVTVERNKAQTEAAKSDAIVDFLRTMLTSADPAKTKGREITVREILDQAAAAIEDGPLVDAEADATTRILMGETYWKLGMLDRAEQMYTSAAETAGRRLGRDHPVQITALNTLALVYNEQGRSKEAGALTERVYDGLMRTMGERDTGTLSAMNNVARWWGNQGRFDEALALMRRCVELRSEILGPADRKTLISVDNVGRLLYQSGHPQEAEAWHRRALDGFMSAFGEDDPQTLGTLQNLAETMRKLDRLYEAEALMRRTVAGRRRVLGEENLFTIGNINYLGRILMDQGKHDQAEPLLRESVDLAAKVVGPDHQYTIGWQVYLGTCVGVLGRFEEAERLLLDSYQRAGAKPENASRLTVAADALAKLYDHAGRPQDAKAWRAKAAPALSPAKP